MGCYVNPPTGTKETWLLVHGREVGRIGDGVVKIPAWDSFEAGHLPVVLVDAHELFNAAGVAYCESEYAVFTDIEDDRYREIYSVPVSALRGVSPLDEYLRRA